jgi:hypothetical protein
MPGTGVEIFVELTIQSTCQKRTFIIVVFKKGLQVGMGHLENSKHLQPVAA